MEILITKEGFLEIKRGKKFKKQRCRRDDSFCGDCCPLFAEPRIKDNLGKGTLSLCQQTVIRFDKITDKRDKETILL